MSNDRARPDPFRDVLPFVLTADARSFRAAARLLGVTPSGVTRAVARLEGSLGVRLLARTSRTVSVTADGAAFLARCREAVTLMEAARSRVAAAQTEILGSLRVTVPLGLGRSTLLPALPAFLAKHPGVRVEIMVTDRRVDLLQESVDVAVRIGELPDSALVARKVGGSRFATVAAPRYLRKFGVPRQPGDLSRHRCLRYLGTAGTTRAWRFAPVTPGPPEIVDVEPLVTLDHGESLVDLARAGVGIAQAPDYLTRAAVAAGELKELFRDRALGAGDIYCVRAGERHASAKVRAFIDFVAALLARRPRRAARSSSSAG